MFAITENRNNRVNGDFAGLEGTVESVINQGNEWKIVVNGTPWTACSRIPHTLKPKDRVKVLDREKYKLRLIIEPL
jgi:membrane protein implicated in regulation of membrane protease activity